MFVRVYWLWVSMRRAFEALASNGELSFGATPVATNKDCGIGEIASKRLRRYLIYNFGFLHFVALLGRRRNPVAGLSNPA